MSSEKKSKKKTKIIVSAAAVVLLAGVAASVTVTAQNEYKLIRQFGKVDRVIDAPGISFRIPFLESTQSLPKETLLYDTAFPALNRGIQGLREFQRITDAPQYIAVADHCLFILCDDI